MISDPKELLTRLKSCQTYQDWVKHNQNTFISHFFCQLDSSFVSKTDWDVGFYNKDTGKITVFTASLEIKPADDVFKKPDAKVEELKLDDVKISADEAFQIFKEEFPNYFTGQRVGNGFLILQTLNDVTVWNFTFITKALKFINMKINSETGKVTGHEVVELIQK